MAKKRILIVEDDPLLVTMYKTKFSLEGYDIVAAGDGEEALGVIKSTKPDFLILDVMMPKLSGMDLLEELHKDEELKKIPVLMLSNLSQPESMEKALKMGVKDFLLKANYTPSQIVDKVKSYL